MATLVHDDAVDAAPLRRGQPTVFAQAGREAAVATGDLLLVARAAGDQRESATSAQTRVLADACLALSQGEFAQRHDAFSARREPSSATCTAATSRPRGCSQRACVLGALSAARPEPELTALERFGARVGLAFQMLDDVLDVSGPPERTGKRRGTDLLEGTTTLPLILAREADPVAGARSICATVTTRRAGRGALRPDRCDRMRSTRAARSGDRRWSPRRSRRSLEVDPELAPPSSWSPTESSAATRGRLQARKPSARAKSLQAGCGR